MTLRAERQSAGCQKLQMTA